MGVLCVTDNDKGQSEVREMDIVIENIYFTRVELVQGCGSERCGAKQTCKREELLLNRVECENHGTDPKDRKTI